MDERIITIPMSAFLAGVEAQVKLDAIKIILQNGGYCSDSISALLDVSRKGDKDAGKD